MVTERSEEVPVGILMELPDFEGSALFRSTRVLAAMAELRRAGLTLILLPVGTRVYVRNPPRRWWRRERSIK